MWPASRRAHHAEGGLPVPLVRIHVVEGRRRPEELRPPAATAASRRARQAGGGLPVPLVRIDVVEGRRSPEELRLLADTVQEVLLDVFAAPPPDPHQAIRSGERRG